MPRDMFRVSLYRLAIFLYLDLCLVNLMPHNNNRYPFYYLTKPYIIIEKPSIARNLSLYEEYLYSKELIYL